MRVKICGLTREEDVANAVEAGADAVGFICGFPESPRNIPTSRARDLMRMIPPFVDSVLVTRSEFVERNPGVVGQLRPSALQLYGPGAGARGFKWLGTKLILPHSFGNGDEIPDARGFDAVLSDTYRKGAFGGTGVVSEWSLCRRLRDAIAPTPLILSGGLNQENVGGAIRSVRPYAVDVSSGVEAAPGIKDRAKVKAFIVAAKRDGY